MDQCSMELAEFLDAEWGRVDREEGDPPTLERDRVCLTLAVSLGPGVGEQEIGVLALTRDDARQLQQKLERLLEPRSKNR